MLLYLVERLQFFFEQLKFDSVCTLCFRMLNVGRLRTIFNEMRKFDTILYVEWIANFVFQVTPKACNNSKSINLRRVYGCT